MLWIRWKKKRESDLKQLLNSKRFALIVLASLLFVAVSILVASTQPERLLEFLKWGLPALLGLFGVGVDSDRRIPMGADRS